MYFRARIFAISILTVSAVLAVVITLSWSRIMKVELDHLDARLCMEAKRMSPKPVFSNTPEFTPDNKLIDDLMSKLRIDSPTQLITLVQSNGAESNITESSKHGETNAKSMQTLISTLNWIDEETLKPIDKNRDHCQLSFFEQQHKEWRASMFNSHHTKSFIAVDVSATTSELRSTLRAALIVVIPLSLLLSIFGAWFIATNAIRPIKRLHKSMDMMTQKDLRHRLSENKEDKEFKVLIDAYNTMLNRLEDSFQQVSRFTSDAAHELKTPLTILRGKLEQAVTSENQSQLDLNPILDEVGHLSAITRKLLLLSQADSGSMALHFEAINLTYLLDELTTDMELLSDDLTLHCFIERKLALQGDTVLLKQLLNNLLVNVMRYSLHEKGVTIQAKQHVNQNLYSIEILIKNFCLPISNDTRNKLFDRFYRGEVKHRQNISGSGLGLSLAREIARAHGGDLTLESSIEDIFSIRLVLPIR